MLTYYILTHKNKKIKDISNSILLLMINQSEIVGLVVAALLAGILLPIGLTDLVNISNAVVTVNGTGTTLGAIAPASIITLLGVVVPIVIVISVMMGFLKK